MLATCWLALLDGTFCMMSAAVGEVSAEHIRDMVAHFDNLANLIPAHFYIDKAEAINLRHMKKSERQSTKAAFKEQHKHNKRAKLDPEMDTSTTAMQRERSGTAASSSAPHQLDRPPLRQNLFTTASAHASQLLHRTRQLLSAPCQQPALARCGAQ